MVNGLVLLLGQEPPKEGPASLTWLILLIVAGIAVLSLALLLLKLLPLWIQARLSRAEVRLPELIRMWLRNVDVRAVVVAKTAASHAGIKLTTQDLEGHLLDGGRVTSVVRALIAARKANIELSWKTATAIDLAGRDVLEAVQTCVSPKVLDCPDAAQGRQAVEAIAKDGVQLRIRARVTVKTHIQRLIGGATQETIISRVAEGLVSAVGSAQSHAAVLSQPDAISKAVLARGLDAGTAFEILSIDIVDLEVGTHVGAQLQASQAEAEMRRAKAEAEQRGALAAAREQEMRALAAENEAKVPLAIAEAFRSGSLGVMDYYRMRNMLADTQMRESIARPRKRDKDKEKEKEKEDKEGGLHG
jgi:uncharacterized protein YqfA (UPF0365 family)